MNSIFIKCGMLLLLCLVSYFEGISQRVMYTTKGVVRFYSSAPLEDIKAENRQPKGYIDLIKKKIVVEIPVAEFEFQKLLMKEHFNENYLETHRYPKATFYGSFKSTEEISTSLNREFNIDVEGDLTIHGVTNRILTKAQLRVSNGLLSALTKFNVRIADYNIEIPRIVFQNIAEVVEISLEIEYNSL